MTRAPAGDLDVGRSALAGAFACAVVGLLALATSGPVGPLPVVALALAVGAAAFRLRKGRGTRVEAATLRTGLGLFLAAVVIVPAHSLLAGSWLIGGVDLLVLLQANRLFALRTAGARNVVGHVLVVTLLMLMAAAVLTINFAFLGAVFLFCIVGTWTAMFQTLWDPAAKGPDARVPRAVAGVAVGSGVALFAMTCALFAILPRIQFQAFETGFLQVQGMSGFSEEVQLGDLGSVKQDRTPVMRVTLTGRKMDESRLYWRGMSLDKYDGGGRWRVGDPEETEIRGRSFLTAQRQQFTVDPKPRPDYEPVVQDVIFEPLDVSVLFGLATMTHVEGDMRLLTRNTTDSIFFRASRFGRLRYVVYSDVRDVDPATTREEEIAAVDARYLEIPPELKAAIEPLAREMAGEGSAWRKARRIEAALQTWDYSLQAKRGSRPDPIEGFLLETKSGWCEQYSSSMVMLLRALGIPARMTNGFSGGEKNEFGGYWLVRNSDAHSWVEVPFEKSGWVIFDPTPGQGPQAPSFGSRIKRGFDFLRTIWTQRVVEYNLIDQFQILQSASRQADRLGSRLTDDVRSALSGGTRGGLVLGGLVVLTATGVVLSRKKRLPADPRRRAAADAQRWWAEVERRFRRDGIIRRAGETAKELAARAGHPEWADLYYVARFGERPLSESERNEIARVRASL